MNFWIFNSRSTYPFFTFSILNLVLINFSFIAVSFNMRKSHSHRMILCVCTSKRCGEVKSFDSDGKLVRGNKIHLQLFRQHQLEDERISQLRSVQDDHRSEDSRPSSPDVEAAPPVPIIPDEPSGSNSASLHQSPSLQQPSTSASQSRPAERVTPNDQDENLYDTSSYLDNDLESANPVLIYPLLIAASLVLFEHISTSTASWLLGALRGLIQLVKILSLGRVQTEDLDDMSFFDQLTLEELPQHIRTVFSKFQLDPKLMIFNCCPACFALYHVGHTPPRCTYRLDKVPGLFSLDESTEADLTSLDEELDEDNTCSQILFQADGRTPVRTYAVQDLKAWITRFVARPEIEEALEKTLITSRKPYKNSNDVSDIHESYAWKRFRDRNGVQYTASSGNLTFGMFVDGINPYGNKISGRKASITFIVLVCLTLPFELRYLPENLFLVGIVPGPKEPSLERMNHVLSPVIVQLKSLWREGIYLSETSSHPNGRRIHAALLPFIADLPALRGTLGFASYNAHNFCSFCHLTKDQIENFNQESWPKRTVTDHRRFAFACRDAEDPTERDLIFEEYGIRYSVLNELEYWRLIDFQVVDSMHNLLLGLLNFHCRRFWAMNEVQDADPDVVRHSVQDTRDLLNDLANNDSDDIENHRNTQCEASQPESGAYFNEIEFNTNTSSDDPDFEQQGWDGEWLQPEDPDEAVFDPATVQHLNQYLPRVIVPSWVTRVIPALGKASFGKLKADEWRNLFTIQLPLLLIPKWTDGDQYHLSLLKNFSHLVSLVQLALKRSMNVRRIRAYRTHLKKYLESSIILFPNCKLAPNHHMAFHIGDCLEKFGPVRSWWSFPFERLMGGILKTCNNNKIGQMEITFMKGFNRAGNLAARLKGKRVPTALKPYLPQLSSIIEPMPHVLKTTSSLDVNQAIESDIYRQLIDHMNRKRLNECSWKSAAEWTFLPEDEKAVTAPVTGTARFLPRVVHKDVAFTTFKTSKADSIVQVKSHLDNSLSFGKIGSIFVHRRIPTGSLTTIQDTWVSVEFFEPVPPTKPNCFLRLNEPDVQVHLRLTTTKPPSLVHINQITSHCAWIQYQSKEITPQLDIPTIALVSLDRE